MKLLIVTQAVDQNDPILGFFCNWLTEFSKHFDRIEVICLKEGEHYLPANVHVHSLNKPASKLYYIARFGWLIWKLRSHYDRVLVHMNPEYVILGRGDWWLMGKKVSLWYNHPNADLKFSIAAFLADKIFYTSSYAAPAKLEKAQQMPVGIDTDIFKPQAVPRQQNAVYMQGRIMPSKKVEVAFAALRQVPDAQLTLVGPQDSVYGKELREKYADLISAGRIAYAGVKRNTETPALYCAHRTSINQAASGHFDKSVFESMACETPVIVSSKAFTGLVPDEWIVPENDPKALAEVIQKMLALPENEYRALGKELREVVVREHSLTALAVKLTEVLARL